MYRNHILYTRNYFSYIVRKYKSSSTTSVQIVGYNNLICAKSLIYLNTITLFNPNSLTLKLISLLVCKLDYIQNLTFYALVNLEFTYCFINITVI